MNLANVAHYQGQEQQARDLAEEAKALLVAVGAKQQIGVCLLTLGHVAFARGEGEQAIALYREALALYQGLHDKRGIAECLECLAGVGAAARQPEIAARLFGAAEALREATRASLPPSDRPAYDRSVAETRRQLPDEIFTKVYADGRACPLDQAIDEAMRVTWQHQEEHRAVEA